MGRNRTALLALGLAVILGGCSMRSGRLDDPGPDEAKKEQNENQTSQQAQLSRTDLGAKLAGHWYYDHLPAEEKQLYETLYEGIANWEMEIPLDGVSLETVTRLNRLIRAEHPEFFHLSSLVYYTWDGVNEDSILSYQPQYCMSLDEYRAKLAAVQDAAAGIVNLVESSVETEYEAEEMVHDYLVETISYYSAPLDYESGETADFQTIYGALVSQEANCMGYAAAMSYLMNQVGVSCACVQGMADPGTGVAQPHEWNVIRVNGEWYHVDVCWDDPTSTDYEADEERTPSHAYFNLSETEIVRSRDLEQNRTEWGELPDCTCTDDNWFRRHERMLESADAFQSLLNQQVSDMAENGTVLEVRFSSPEAFEETMSRLQDMVQTSVSGSGLLVNGFSLSPNEAMDSFSLELV